MARCYNLIISESEYHGYGGWYQSPNLGILKVGVRFGGPYIGEGGVGGVAYILSKAI